MASNTAAIQTISTNQPFDTNKYIDMMMTSLMLQNVAQNNNGSDQWWTMLIKFVVITSSDEIKKLLKYITETSSSQIKIFLNFIFVNVSTFLSTYILLSIDKIKNFSTQTEIIASCMDTECCSKISTSDIESNCYEFKSHGIQNVANELYKYILKYGKYNSIIDSVIIKNDKSIITTEIYNEIAIPYENIMISFIDPIEFETKNENGLNTVTHMAYIDIQIEDIDNKILIPYDQIKSFSDILPSHVKKIINGIKEKVIKDNNNDDKMFDDEKIFYFSESSQHGYKITKFVYTSGNIGSLNDLKHYWEMNFIFNFLKKCPNAAKNMSMYEIHIYFSLVHNGKCIRDALKQKYPIENKNEIKLYGYVFNTDECSKCTGTYFNAYGNKIKLPIDKFLIDLYDIKPNQLVHGNTFTINISSISSISNLTNQEMHAKYMNFIQELHLEKKSRDTIDNKIKVFSLSIEHDEITSTIANPEYEEYQEKKKILLELIGSKPNNGTTDTNISTINPALHNMYDIHNMRNIYDIHNAYVSNDPYDIKSFLKQTPKKEITIITLKPKIITKEINTRYKSIHDTNQ